MGFLEKLFGTYSEREVKKLQSIADKIESLEQNNKALELRNTGLKNEINKIKEKNKILQDELDKLKNVFEKFKQKISDLYNFFVNKMWG